MSKSILSLHSHSDDHNETSLLSEDYEQSPFFKELNSQNIFASRFKTVDETLLKDIVRK